MDKKRMNSNNIVFVISCLIIIGTIFLIGLTSLLTTDAQSPTRNDYQEISIVYDRITTTNGEGPMHTIYSKNDGKSFRVGNVVAKMFNKTMFNEQVASGDTIVLTVLKAEFESKTSQIETLGIKKGDSVLMDFDEAFKARADNNRLGFIMALALLPLSGVLLIAFLICLLLHSKGIIGKKEDPSERLNIKMSDNLL